jgi:hypothetical protein
LFAFLLTVPFSQRFHDLTQLQQYMFFASLPDVRVYWTSNFESRKGWLPDRWLSRKATV